MYNLYIKRYYTHRTYILIQGNLNIYSIRDNPLLFKTFQHNQDIVKFINLSTCENSPLNELPTGWKTDQDKKQRNFYVNTEKKFTSYYHPKILGLFSNSELSPSGSGFCKPIRDWAWSREHVKEIQKEDTISETEDVPEPDETESMAESVQDPILTYPDQVIIFLSKNTNEMLIRKLPQIKDEFTLRLRP